jgi:hypothetical protein
VKVTINTVCDGVYTIADLAEQDGVLDMVASLNDPDQHVLGFEMDGSMVYLVKRNIVSIEVD